MYDLTIQQIILRAVAWLAIAGVYGCSVAAIARALGDRGPKFDGRLTLNPFTHLDVIGAVGAIVFRIGWIKPIAIDAKELRFGRLGLVACVLGSSAALLVFAWLVQLAQIPAVTLISGTASQTAVILVETIGRLAIWAAVVNLVPLPPLTGGHLLVAVYPPIGAALARYRVWTTVAVVILVASGLAEVALQPAYDVAAALIF